MYFSVSYDGGILKWARLNLNHDGLSGFHALLSLQSTLKTTIDQSILLEIKSVNVVQPAIVIVMSNEN